MEIQNSVPMHPFFEEKYAMNFKGELSNFIVSFIGCKTMNYES